MTDTVGACLLGLVVLYVYISTHMVVVRHVAPSNYDMIQIDVGTRLLFDTPLSSGDQRRTFFTTTGGETSYTVVVRRAGSTLQVTEVGYLEDLWPSRDVIELSETHAILNRETTEASGYKPMYYPLTPI